MIGRGPSRYAIGANVFIRTADVWQMREVIAGCNYKSQNELILHFGLADADTIDEIVTLWPGGTTRTVRNLTADRSWTLYPPDKLADADGNGTVDLTDFAAFATCVSGPVPGSLTPGCEMMDIDGDGDVDLINFGDFQTRFQQ